MQPVASNVLWPRFLITVAQTYLQLRGRELLPEGRSCNLTQRYNYTTDISYLSYRSGILVIRGGPVCPTTAAIPWHSEWPKGTTLQLRPRGALAPIHVTGVFLRTSTHYNIIIYGHAQYRDSQAVAPCSPI